jgi:single-strand DNA-binding protein
MSIPTIQGLAGITADPEMKYTPQGKAVLSVRLAFSDRKYNEQTRTWDTSKSFYVDGTAWEETAERLSAQLAKGDQVYVEGRIETQQWEKDGEKKSKPVLQLRTVRKLEKGTPQQGQQQPAQPAAQGGWGAAPSNAGEWGSAPAGADQQVPF